MGEDRKEGRKREESIFRSPRDIFKDFTNRICAVFPEDFSQHLSNATKEKLLALRSLIDHAIERTEHRKHGKNN